MVGIQMSLTLLSVHESFFTFGAFVWQLLAVDAFNVFFQIFFGISVELVTVRAL